MEQELATALRELLAAHDACMHAAMNGNTALQLLRHTEEREARDKARKTLAKYERKP